MLTKQLNLTEDQQAKIKPILEASHEKAQQLRESHKPQQGANGEAAQPPSREERQEMRKQMEQIHNDTISQVRAQLTPDQQTKFDQLVANMNQHEREGMRHRRGNEGGNGENPPPQQPQ
jgi:Spy/CpxP family protein refolding chaperone